MNANAEITTAIDVQPVNSARQQSKRLAREWKTLEAMVRIYCRDRHLGRKELTLNSDGSRAGAQRPTPINREQALNVQVMAPELCLDCQGLLNYAGVRLDRCRFGAEKPTCANCPVHCYQRNRREEMKVVMRYAGPRMLWEHPILSLWHWLDGFRRVRMREA